ncbi:hypothetical protein GCM10010923_08250 [Blastomonas marina]|uniref:Uncharacterized protein n=2 Tax=Blastomonas marina TaxID=1867408 RepID=A0ABQ1F7R4_9SPHN|nr:hypothetical protein GCM10010923_08250 [Blastomonas marina]
MPRSTAKFIAYDLRPAKQTERRLLLDYLESLKETGVEISSSRYIGMGGAKFYDFAMVHRFLGISDLVSCEWNETMARRGNYNRPFALIDVQNRRVGRYIDDHLHEKLAVTWLDYDTGLNDDIIEDIVKIGSKAVINSSFFVTVCSDLPDRLRDMSGQERQEDISEIFGAFSDDVAHGDLEEANFSMAVSKILTKAFQNSFAGRTDGLWLPIFRVDYRDSSRMLTYGGTFANAEVAKKLKKIVKRRLPFLLRDEEFYSIRNYNLTERERHLFEFSATARRNCKEANKLRDLGFTEADFKAYEDLVRFLPRYVETYF